MEDQESEARPARGPQYLAAFCACLGAVAVGSILGFTSPAGLQLTEYDNSSLLNNSVVQHLNDSNFHIFDDSFYLTKEKMAWVSSTVSLGALWGGLAGGSFLNIFGRRGTMLLSLIPALGGWLLIGLAVNFSMMVAGRIATGAFIGLTCISVNTYIGEIASSDIRGTLGTGFQLMVNVGLLLSYSLGVFLNWYTLALVSAAVPLVFWLAMYFNRESPFYLILKGRTQQAREALLHLRGAGYNIEEELQVLSLSLEESKRTSTKLSDMLKPSVLRPLLISISLMFFQQFSGANAVLFNLSVIFKSAGTDLSESMCSIIVAAVLVFGTLLSSFLMDKMGRKVLLVISAIMMFASHVGLGSFFYLLQQDKAWTLLWLQWLPLLSLVVFILSFAIGYAPIPWLMMGELFPPNVRSMSSGIATSANWFFSFVVTVSFEWLQGLMGDYGVYWMYAVLCLVATLFSVLVVQETKGKTLEQISEMFGGHAQLSRNTNNSQPLPQDTQSQQLPQADSQLLSDH